MTNNTNTNTVTRQQIIKAIHRYSATEWAVTYRTEFTNYRLVRDGLGDAYEDVKLVTVVNPTRKSAIADIEWQLANGATLQNNYVCRRRIQEI